MDAAMTETVAVNFVLDLDDPLVMFAFKVVETEEEVTREFSKAFMDRPYLADYLPCAILPEHIEKSVDAHDRLEQLLNEYYYIRSGTDDLLEACRAWMSEDRNSSPLLRRRPKPMCAATEVIIR